MTNFTTTERLEITAVRMTGNVTTHTATGFPDGWRVTWLGDRTVDYNAAISAMMIANAAASIADDEIEGRIVGHDDERRLRINDLARELDMSGAEAELLVSVAIPDAIAVDCPAWCHDRHEASDDDTHYGPAVDVAGRTTTEDYPYMLALQREVGDETEIILMTTDSQRMNEPRDRAFTVDQARQLHAALGELLAVVDDKAKAIGDTVADCTERALRVLAEYEATGRPVCWGSRPLGRLEGCLARDLRMLDLVVEDLVELVEVAEGEQS